MWLDVAFPESAEKSDHLALYTAPRLGNADFSDVTLMMADYNLATLAVVDDADRVVGVVTVDYIIALLVPENWRRRAEAAGV